MDNSLEEILCELSIQEISLDPNNSDLWKRELQIELIETGLISVVTTNPDAMPNGTKGVDPVLAALGFSMLSNSLPQILTFLHDWALRREGRVLKIKIQTEKDRFIEIEIPSSMSKKELTEYINIAQSAIKKKR